jgi:hypothetical protein
MSGTAHRQVRPVADLVITVLLIALFGWALWTSLDWSFRAAVFPRMVTALGLGLVILHLLILLARPAKFAPGKSAPGTPAAGAPGQSDSFPLEGDDELEVHELEYEFGHASRRTWLVNLGWVIAFFGGVFVVGLFPASLVFTLTYLRFGGGRSWRFAAIYTVIVGGVLFGFFDQMLRLSMPLGILQS